jgi:cell division protein FtsI/penicillin-binding protein 2
MKTKNIILILILISVVLATILFMNTPHYLKRLESYAIYYGLLEKNIEKLQMNLNRGKIVLIDGQVLAYDKSLYKVMILTKLDTETFSKLLIEIEKVIKINKNRILKKLSRGDLYIIISYNVTKEQAKKLKYLALKYENLKIDGKYYNVLQVQFSGQKRIYPKKNF